MLTFLWFLLSCILFYAMFCLAYSFGMKDAEGNSTVDKRMRNYALWEFISIYIIMNIFSIIGFFSKF